MVHGLGVASKHGVLLEGGVESENQWGLPAAKAPLLGATHAEKRKCGERTGLDTLVVHTLNDEP